VILPFPLVLVFLLSGSGGFCFFSMAVRVPLFLTQTYIGLYTAFARNPLLFLLQISSSCPGDVPTLAPFVHPFPPPFPSIFMPFPLSIFEDVDARRFSHGPFYLCSHATPPFDRLTMVTGFPPLRDPPLLFLTHALGMNPSTLSLPRPHPCDKGFFLDL